MSDSRTPRYHGDDHNVEDEGWEDLDDFVADNVKVKHRQSKRKPGRTNDVMLDAERGRKRDKPRWRPPAHKQIEEF
jgi:hypothetical protein